MSKNKNYSKFFSKNNKQNETIENTSIAEEEKIEEIIQIDELKDAVVANCGSLYVRPVPSKDSRPIDIIKKDDKVKVNLAKSTEDFYFIRIKDEDVGFCMKQFIQILN